MPFRRAGIVQRHAVAGDYVAGGALPTRWRQRGGTSWWGSGDRGRGIGRTARSPDWYQCRYRPGVSQPEMQRQVRQQRADIDSLYELVEGVDQKVDSLDEKVSALDVKLDRRLDELSGQLAEVLRQLGGQ